MGTTPIQDETAALGRCELSESGDALRLDLAGEFRLSRGLPDLEPLRERLARGGITTVNLSSADVTAWDTGLLVWTARVAELVRIHGGAFERDGLPPGALRLAKLSEAVPESEEAKLSTLRPRLWVRLTHGANELALEVERQLRFLGELTAAFGRLLRGRIGFRAVDFWLLVQECGAQALPIVGICALLIGLVLAFVGAVQLRQFGAEIYVADLVGLGMTREMGALITAVVMAGRTGAGFAANLGTMQAGEEIDSLRTLGIEPMDFLVVPRVLALVFMLPLLTVFANALGIIGGGYVGTQMLDIPAAQYVTQMEEAVGLDDAWVGIVKSFAFAVIVAFTGCLRGMQSGRSSAAVGQAATSAVVTGILYIIVADAIFTVIFEALGI